MSLANLEFSVQKLEVLLTYNGFTDVVRSVHFTIKHKISGLKTSAKIKVILPEPNDPSFIEFPNLTKTDVRDLVVDRLKEAGITRQQFLERVEQRLANGITDFSPDTLTELRDPPWV